MSSSASNPADDRARLIVRPNVLKQKVGSGGFPLAGVAAAEAAVDRMAINYPEVARQDLAKLQQAFDAANSAPAERATHLRQVFTIAHDMKGQGATFGYPLLTRVANLLCRYVDREHPPGPTEMTLIAAHVDALRAVIANDIAGDGGTLGEEICGTLEAAAARTAGPRSGD